MRLDIKNLATFFLENYIYVLFLVFIVILSSALGLQNFKLDASSDALVIENDYELL